MNRRDAIAALVGLGVVAGSCASSAQAPGQVWHVGYLTLGSASPNPNSDAFVSGMRELGYVEGKNLIIERRFANGDFERLPALAADLVRLRVDVIVAAASAAIGPAQKATSTIPIVMTTTGDPVGSGFVKSLSRPGGNITGLSGMGGDTGAKLFDLLLSVVPAPARVALLVTPTSTTYRAIVEKVQTAAQQAGVKTLVYEASTPTEIENAFAAMATQNASAVIVGASPFFYLQRQQIVDLALRYRLPSMFGNPDYAQIGGLMAYGGNITQNYRRAATYVDKILKGARPGDLPVEQPALLQLIVNLRTAKAIGLSIPQTVLLRADEVIR